MLAFVKDRRFYMICLETDIAVVADSFEQLQYKMSDAIISYFNTFSAEEIEAGKYIRKAPRKYRIIYRTKQLLSFVENVRNFTSKKAYYDNHSEHLRFA